MYKNCLGLVEEKKFYFWLYKNFLGVIEEEFKFLYKNLGLVEQKFKVGCTKKCLGLVEQKVLLDLVKEKF